MALLLLSITGLIACFNIAGGTGNGVARFLLAYLTDFAAQQRPPSEHGPHQSLAFLPWAEPAYRALAQGKISKGKIMALRIQIGL